MIVAHVHAMVLVNFGAGETCQVLTAVTIFAERFPFLFHLSLLQGF